MLRIPSRKKRKTRLKWLSVLKDAQWMTYPSIRITLTMISYNKIIIWLTIRSTHNYNKNTAHSWAQPKNTYVDLNCPVKSLAWLAQHTRWKHIWKMQSPMQVVLKSRKQVVEIRAVGRSENLGGGANINLVGIICTPSSDRVNWTDKIWEIIAEVFYDDN